MKAKEWIKEHKKEVALGIVGAGAIGISAYIGVNFAKYLRNKADMKSISDACPGLEKIGDIDKDIFTSLAPEMEEAILDDNVIEKVIERTYDGPTSKHVKIVVSDTRAARFELEKMWGKNWNKVLEIIGTQDIFDVYDMFGAETIKKSNELVRKVF